MSYRVGAIETPRSSFSNWIWPVAMIHGNPPAISDGFGRDKREGRGHFGIDVMHRRRSDPRDVGVVGSPNFVTYPGEKAFLSGDGRVQSAGNSSTGHVVRVNHRVDGRSVLSVYRHLSSIEPGIEEGATLSRGTVLGNLGDNPSDSRDPIHLHFELWQLDRGLSYPDATFDPAAVMGVWKVLRIPEGDLVGGKGILKGGDKIGTALGVGLLAFGAGIFYLGMSK